MKEKKTLSLKENMLKLHRYMGQLTGEKRPQNLNDHDLFVSLSVPFAAYLCGFVDSPDEAFELYDEQKTLKTTRLNALLEEKINETESPEEKESLKEIFYDSQQTYEFDPQKLLLINVPEEKIKACFVSLEETLSNMGQSGFLNTSLLSRFKKEYREPLQVFVDWATLLEARRTNTSCLLSDRKHSEMFNLLHCLHSWLCLQEALGVDSHLLKKADTLWFRLADHYYGRTLKAFENLPQHPLFPKLHLQIAEKTKAIRTLFSSDSDEKALSDQVKRLLQTLRGNQALVKVPGHEKLMQSFEEIVHYCSESQTLDRVVQGLVKPLTFEEKMQSVFEDTINKYGIRELSNPTSVFALMHDHEVLYFMGVLNEEEYRLCEKHAYKKTQVRIPVTLEEMSESEDEDEPMFSADYEVQERVEPRHILEMFETILDEENYALPLKAEYIEALERFHRAGMTAYELCCPSSISSYRRAKIEDWDQFFHPGYADTKDSFISESEFMTDLIYLSRFLKNNQPVMQKLTLLSDGYWQEAVRRLQKLTPHHKYPERAEQMEKSMEWLRGLLPENRLNNFQKRRRVYIRLLPELQEILGDQVMTSKSFKQNYQRRDFVLSRFGKYIRPFEKRLKMTNQRWMADAYKRMGITFVKE